MSCYTKIDAGAIAVILNKNHCQTKMRNILTHFMSLVSLNADEGLLLVLGIIFFEFSLNKEDMQNVISSITV